MMDHWGRRKICFVANIGFFLGGLLVCLAQKVSMLISGKTIEGFFRSMVATSITVRTRHIYTVSEISLRARHHQIVTSPLEIY
jgi:MFS family permease